MSTKLSPVLVADYNTSLTTKISVGGTTATLLSNIDDDDNTMPDGLVYLTLDGDNSSKEHISATKTGANLTAIKSVSRQGVESSGVAREHRVGSTVILTNFAHIKFINDLLDGTTDLDGSNPLKYDANPTLTDDKHIATKKYIDDIAIAGCSKATEVLEGISKLSVAAASATAPLAVGDNDPRIPTQDENNALTGGQNTPSTAKPYVNNDIVVSHTPNTAGNLVGGASAQSAFASWAAITDGSFRITVDGVAYNVDAVDFSGDGSMNDVAATIQAALRTATSGTETVVWSTDHFVITSVQEDEDSEISVTTTSTGTVGTDISGLGDPWMDCDAGTATQGTSDHDSLVKLDTVGKIESELIEKDTDGTLAADSDDRIASQKAVKAYVDTEIPVINKFIGAGIALGAKDYWNFVIPLLIGANVIDDFFAFNGINKTYYIGFLELSPTADVTNYIKTQNVINNLYFNTSKKVIIEFGIKIGGASGEVNHWGLNNFGGDIAFTDYEDHTYDGCGFVIDSSGNLYAKTSDASVGHTLTQITGITITNLNTYRIEFDPGVNVKFYVNGVLEATITTNLPNADAIKFGVGGAGNTSSCYVSTLTEPNVSIEK